MTLDEWRAFIGFPVKYDGGPHTELGIVYSVGPQYVFVTYSGSWQPKATAPDQLQLVMPADQFRCRARSMAGGQCEKYLTHDMPHHCRGYEWDDTEDVSEYTSRFD